MQITDEVVEIYAVINAPDWNTSHSALILKRDRSERMVCDYERN